VNSELEDIDPHTSVPMLNTLRINWILKAGECSIQPRTDLVLQSANTGSCGKNRASSSTKASFTNNCTAHIHETMHRHLLHRRKRYFINR